jgi:hypothetical protein
MHKIPLDIYIGLGRTDIDGKPTFVFWISFYVHALSSQKVYFKRKLKYHLKKLGV